MIGYWGYLMFEVNDTWWQGPQDIVRTASGRYDTFYPANASDRPKNIFLGPELGEVTFTMCFDQRFNASIRDLLASFATWINEGLAGELVIGTKVYGFNKWVCTKAVERFTEVLKGGLIVRAEVDVTLKEI